MGFYKTCESQHSIMGLLYMLSCNTDMFYFSKTDLKVISKNKWKYIQMTQTTLIKHLRGLKTSSSTVTTNNYFCIQ